MMTEIDECKLIDDWLGGGMAVTYDFTHPASIVIRAKDIDSHYL
jgi:hypothetical protein